jgi:hypothetical protein
MPDASVAVVPTVVVDAAAAIPDAMKPIDAAATPADAARRVAKRPIDAAPTPVTVKVERPDAAPAPVPVPVPAKPAMATLEMTIIPYCRGTIGGHEVKTSTIELEPGTYKLECTWNNRKFSDTIILKPGETRKYRKSFLAELTVTTTVDIRFAGQAHPAGSRFKTQAGTWRVDVVGGKSTSLNINQDCTIRTEPELGCY